MFALEDFIKACPVGLIDSLSQKTLEIQMKGTVKLKSEKQHADNRLIKLCLFSFFYFFYFFRMLCSMLLLFLRMLCLFLPCVVFCVCFIPDTFFCMFLSICFLVRVLFRMFSSACFVPDVLLQSGHPPPLSPPAVPMERCQPTPLSAARAPPALWGSRKVV